MAERTVTVRLKAVVDDYKRAMAGAKSATDQVVSQGENWRRLGQSTAALGDSMTRNITLPIVAVGAAAAKMALDFDNAFTQMQTLAGVSASEVEALKSSVLDLAGETGKAPQELAEALYFLQSSGLSSAEAMDALAVSAKASAAGLGDTVVIADAVSSAMLAYAESGLTAAEATDVLVATARAGKAEPTELAQQMGRLLPIASELGISFGDVGGAIAALSTKGNDAAAATTQLSNVMAKLLSPSIQAQEALAEAGMSVDDLRAMIEERGLLGTLEVLKERLGDSGFVKFFEDIQAKEGVLALLGGDLEKTRGIFDDVNNSVGATEEAFGKWADSMGADNARAFSEFQVALIRLGEAVLPIASDIMSFASDIAEAFSKLPKGVQEAIIAFGLVAAAVGPLLSAGGRIVAVYGGVRKLLENFGTHLTAQAAAGFNEMGDAASGAATNTTRFGTGLTRLGGYLAAGGAVVGGLILLRETLGDIAEPASAEELSQLQRQLLRLGDTGRVAGEELREALDAVGNTGNPRDWDEAHQAVEDLDEALAQLASRNPEVAAEAFRRLTRLIADETGVSVERVRGEMESYHAAVAEVETANETAAASVDQTTSEITDQATALQAATEIAQGYVDELTAMFDPLFGMSNALRGNQEASAAVTAAEMELAAAVAEHGASSMEAMEATAALTDAQWAAGDSAVNVMQATAQLNAAVAANPGLLNQAKAALDEMADQQLITRGTANVLKAGLDQAAGSAVNLGKTDPRIDITQTGADATVGTLGWVKRQADQLDGRRVTISIAASYNIDPGILAKVGGRQHGGPITAGRPYVVGEAGPELFISDESGTILPNSHLERLMSSSDLHSRSGGMEGLRSISVGFGDLSSVIQQSTTRLLTGLGGELRRICHDTDHISNGIHTLIKQNAWGPQNVRWFEDLNSIHRQAKVPGFHQGGVVPGRPGEEILALLQAGETVIPASAPFAGTAATIVNVNVSMAGAFVPNNPAARQWVSQAWNEAVRGNLVNIRPEAVR